jgi:putative (di)nucleoside polyphosphate hydrolase
MTDKNSLYPQSQTFRAGVGAVILDGKGRVLALERRDVKNAWQLPQGGLERGEEPEQAVYRELREETGLGPDDIRPLGRASRLLAYELPAGLRTPKTGRGQVHYWFLFGLQAADKVITLGDKNEFRSWRWLAWDGLLSRVVDFRRAVYAELEREFSGRVHASDH